MGGGSDKSSSTTTSASGQVTATTNDLLSRLTNQVGQGTAVFGSPLYTGLSGQTQTGINNIYTSAANNAPILSDAYSWARDTMGSDGYNDALRRAESGIGGYLAESQADAPGFQQLRKNLIDDVTASTNAAFNASGRFGGGSNVTAMSEGLTRGLGGLDYQNYTDRLNRMMTGNQALAGIGQTAMGNAAGAAAAAPGLYGATLMPGQAQIGAGQLLDADSLARRQAENDLFRRQNDAGWDTLARASSILSGAAPSAGTTTTQSTPSTPWWQTALGGALGLGSLFL